MKSKVSQRNTTLRAEEIGAAAQAAVERAVEARRAAGIELSSEELNTVSGAAGYYLKDPFIYGIKIDPWWFRTVAPGIEPVAALEQSASKVGG